MAESAAICSTKYSSTDARPPTVFKYIFDVANFKEESTLMLQLDRTISSQPFTWSAVDPDGKDRNYMGGIFIAGQPRDPGRDSKGVVVGSLLKMLTCDSSSSDEGLDVELRVKAELLSEKTFVNLVSARRIQRLETAGFVRGFIAKSSLEEKLEHLRASPVTLRVTLELKHWPTQESFKWTEEAKPSPPLQPPPYFEALRSDEQLFDLTIVCGGKEFRGHKLILSAASTVFARMLQAPMAEASAGKVIMEDVEPGSMQLMLDYIYNGQCNPKTSDEILDLLYCGEKYELKGLKTLMLQQMARTLSEENAVKYLSAAWKVDPRNPCTADMVSFCKTRFIALCALNPENKKFLGANLDLFCSSDQ